MVSLRALMGGLVFALLLSACTLELADSLVPVQPESPIFESSDSSGPQEDLYQKWVAYDQRRAEQDKWDELADTERHELKIDADLSDEWIDCERDLSVDVSIENTGDVVEEEAFVLLDNDKSGIHSRKIVEELVPGHFATVRFPLALENTAPGDYEFTVRVFREEDELEGTDAVELKVRNC